MQFVCFETSDFVRVLTMAPTSEDVYIQFNSVLLLIK